MGMEGLNALYVPTGPFGFSIDTSKLSDSFVFIFSMGGLPGIELKSPIMITGRF